MKQLLKLSLLLLVLLLPATAIAHDFEVGNIQYTITSDTTVEVSEYIMPNQYYNDYDNWFHDEVYLRDIEIPSHVTFNNVNYTVTTIGDNAFNCKGFCDYNSEGLFLTDYNITIPHTITSIGHHAFCGYGFPHNIVCLAKTPPIMNEMIERPDDFYCPWPINLFVTEDAYTLYQEINNQYHYFDSIYITDGERSRLPIYKVEYLDQPYNTEYGCGVRINRHENSIVYTRVTVNDAYYTHDYLYRDNWTNNNSDSLYFYYEHSTEEDAYYDYFLNSPKGWIVEFYAIEDGKSPSLTMSGGELYEQDTNLGVGFFHMKWKQFFAFKDSGICYDIDSNKARVTYELYQKPRDTYYDDEEELYDCPYSGDVVIPDAATYYNFETFTTYPVTSIGKDAFKDCLNLNSVIMPASIASINSRAFYNCPRLSFIKCLGAIPPNISVESFDTNIYQNTILYVPRNAIVAYRNANGWRNFQNIAGISVNDFESNGVYYSITGDHEVVVSRGEEAYSGCMMIPESVTVDGETYAVTGVADGAFANANLDFLSIPVAITDNVASNAFEDSFIESVYITGEGAWDDGALPACVDTLYISSGVTSVEGLQVNPSVIYSYAAVPPTCDANAFTDYHAELVVPASSLAAYFTAPYWCNFINIMGYAVEPTGLSLENDSISILADNLIQMNATFTPDNATPQQVFWTSTNDSIAKVGPTNGELTALKAGECDIKARLLDKVVVCHVTVTEIAPTQVALSQEFAKMEVGSQLTLTATVLPEDATDKAVTWSTTNSAVATVDSQGNVMAIGPGECFITATCRDKQAMCHVIVVEHFINIQLDQHELLLLPNHIELLTPTVTPVSTDLAVTSTNPSVAAARLANGKIQVVGIAEGTTTIRVNSTDGYAEPDSCVVKVYTLRGDVNGDGFVNISDATLLISYLVAPSETIHQVNADTNNDGQINISDATRLISYLLTGEELEPKPDNEFETETITVNGVTFDMVSVEGGTFMMGATPEQGDEALDKEKPVHRVTVSSFAMSQTEVTQELWQAVMGNNPSHFTGDPKRPVELVSWNDCQTFITQLNQLTGKRFRLPTEAEWEYAARGGNRYKVTRYAGSNNIDEVAWYDANSDNTTHPVATKAPNELGLYDMTGNVWEWCQDWYALYSADDQTDPTGPETGNNRVLRGGCWNGGTNYDRISFRDNFRPSGSNSSGGLRLVLDQEVVYTVNGVSFTMVPVKGGTFTMGATEEEDADHATFVASPKHQVTLSNFSIGQTEVTQELWVAVMGSNPSQDTSNLQYPVSYINWPDCDSFITKLNELTGLHFRLPTEAEWEYAAKGGANSQGFVYSGSDDLDEVAWISTNSDSHPHQVATKKANELGLYDMNGNIEEWCLDWYSLYTEDPVVNPSGPETGMSKVHRGGRWNGSAKYCRLTRRDGFSQGVKRNYMGMRLAL